MSLSSLFSFADLANKAKNQDFLGTSVHNDIDNLVVKLNQLVEIQPKPFVFLRSNNSLSSNVSDGVLIVQGTTIPALHRGTIRDFNINFTTVAGTVRVVITDRNGTILQDVLRGITNNTNGVGETVLEEGQALAIVGQSAGAGVFTVFCSGSIQKVR